MNKRKLIIRIVAGISILTIILIAGFILIARNQVNLAGFRSTSTAADIQVPPGFTIDTFVTGLNGPRFIHFGPDGVLYAADRGNGRIVALPDTDNDGHADSITVFADNLNNPHSLIYREGSWYVGIPTGVLRLTDTNGDGTADKREILIDDYPTGGHSTRTVEFLPDGRMVVSVGSSCNICEETDPRRAAVVVYDDPTETNGRASGEYIFATGLRNAVGLAIHPESGELWATNNGRDLMGDDLPPETVYIVKDGVNYGWPYCHSGNIVDPDMGFEGACDNVAAPVFAMQAHSAPLGMAFYTGNNFPPEYQGDLFVAFHGSWNRSEPTGYKVVRLPLNGSEPAGPVEDFAFGWLHLEDNASSGRPVGLAVGPDGALYISDDKEGIIYRVFYTGEN